MVKQMFHNNGLTLTQPEEYELNLIVYTLK